MKSKNHIEMEILKK